MNKAFLILAFGTLLIACKSKKTTAVVESTEPTEQQLTASQTKFPGATMAELKQGHDLYFGTCTNCHKAKRVTSEPESEWPKILNEMAKKAKISDDQKLAIHKYVTGVLLTANK